MPKGKLKQSAEMKVADWSAFIWCFRRCINKIIFNILRFFWFETISNKRISSRFNSRIFNSAQPALYICRSLSWPWPTSHSRWACQGQRSKSTQSTLIICWTTVGQTWNIWCRSQNRLGYWISLSCWWRCLAIYSPTLSYFLSWTQMSLKLIA